ncbi:MAG: B12-binding domain-containing radical SAM protein [Deltaproteobacteria bacterium]|nr:MAG: B12-binding domain-containing radical SAM protein [Deltaproteobacteria bacterium]
MNILLVYPPFLDPRMDPEDVLSPPIGLYYLGAYLIEKGHKVQILNWFEMGDDNSELFKALEQFQPQMIGFSILNANRWGAIDLAKLVKDSHPEITVVAGGVGATFLWRFILKHFPQIDYVVTGEAERTFARLVEALEKCTTSEPPHIKGLAMRQDGRVVHSGPPEAIDDLDELPNPANYFKYQHVISSRGCPWSCSFCGSPRFWGRKVRFHSPRYFVDQLEKLFNKGVNFFYVSDDTFTLDKERVINICKLIIDRNLPITWQAISRVSHVDEDILYWMRKAGCIQISYGVESGSRKIRQELNKKLNKADIVRAFFLTRKYGILPRAYFIYGSPGETKKTIGETLDLIAQIKPLSAIFYILDIFPGTALYEQFKKRSGMSEDIWLQRIEDIMYFETDPRLSQDMVLEFGRTLREGFFSRLNEFALDLELAQPEELAPYHADFLSRLAMTFSHGDYSRNPHIKDKDRVAEQLFTTALSYAPNERAYLGLGIMKQKQGNHKGATEILSEGINHFSQSEQLHVCLAVSQMNLGEFSKAAKLLEKFPDSPTPLRYLAQCYSAMGLKDKEQQCLEALKRHSGK